MKKQIISMILFICLLTGLLPGCGAKESVESEAERSEIPDAEGEAQRVHQSEEDHVAELDSHTENENSDETEDNPKLELMDKTALLVTVTRHSVNYNVEPSFVLDKLWEESEYDSEGRVLRYSDLSYASDHFNERWEYTYDDAGNLMKVICYRVKDNEVKSLSEYSYREDDAGHVWQAERDMNGILVYESEFNGDGVLLRRIRYREDGTLSYEQEFDVSGNELRRIYYDEQGNISSRSETEYDDVGNVTLKVDYDAEGNIEVFEGYECDTWMVIYSYWPRENEYDEAGNLIGETEYNYEGNVTEISEYTYDDANHLLKAHNHFFEDEDWEYTDETIYEYDSAGNRTKEIYGPDYWYEYEYDSENRMIKKVKYRNYRLEEWFEYEYTEIEG